jgi:saccharopine dehydrogenase-like NADP-dependent oxidoreductase
MKILVIGAGRMGHGAVFDLAHNSPEVEAIRLPMLILRRLKKLPNRLKARRFRLSNSMFRIMKKRFP